MKSIKKWLEEAKQQGYDWADAAIRNYNPEFSGLNNVKSLTDAIFFAFHWPNSPEGDAFWKSVTDSLNRPSSADPSPTPLHELALLYEGISECIGALRPDSMLREPYRQAIFEAYKSNYEDELAELSEKIAERLGLREEIYRLKKELENVNREFEAHKSTAEELNRSYINEHNENYERMKKIEQLEMLLKEANSKKMVGWLMQQPTGKFFMAKAPVFFKENESWNSLVMTWIELSEDEVKVLTNKDINWSDDEPTPIYK